MNAQEIQALIDAKIKGQGSAIDIGGALPAILGGLNEMASKAISPDSTDLDEETQMQVRKNLGLYYEEPEVDNTVQYDGDPTGKEIYDGKVRLSEDAPDDGDLLSVKKNGEEVQYQVEEYGNYYLIIDGLTNAFAVVFKEKEGEYDLDIPVGVYGYVANPEYSLEYKVKDSEVSKIDPKYIVPATEEGIMALRKALGLYYTEGGVDSQIDEKYLPAIGGGMEPVTLLQVPTADASGITLSDYISDEDVQKLKGGETILAKYTPSEGAAQYFLVGVSYTSGQYGATNFTFYGQRGWAFSIDLIGSLSSSITVNPDGQIQLTGLPTAEMTSEQLAALGFGSLSQWAGKKVNSIYVFDSGTFQTYVFGIIALTSAYLEFWSETSKYVITDTLGALACTVTAR